MSEQDYYENRSAQDAYAPYKKEATYSLVIDAVVALSIVLLFFLAGAQWFLLAVVPLYGLFAYLLNYRTVLRARKEAREELTEMATADILSIKEHRTLSGCFGTVMRELYPKSMRAAQHKLICRGEDGTELVLRCVMSERKRQWIQEGIDSGRLWGRALVYGRDTKILLYFTDPGDTADTFNHMF